MRSTEELLQSDPLHGRSAEGSGFNGLGFRVGFRVKGKGF